MLPVTKLMRHTHTHTHTHSPSRGCKGDSFSTGFPPASWTQESPSQVRPLQAGAPGAMTRGVARAAHLSKDRRPQRGALRLPNPTWEPTHKHYPSRPVLPHGSLVPGQRAPALPRAGLCACAQLCLPVRLQRTHSRTHIGLHRAIHLSRRAGCQK